MSGTHKSLERRPEEEKVGRLLVAADFAQCDSAWLVALLRTLRGRSCLANCDTSQYICAHHGWSSWGAYVSCPTLCARQRQWYHHRAILCLLFLRAKDAPCCACRVSLAPFRWKLSRNMPIGGMWMVGQCVLGEKLVVLVNWPGVAAARFLHEKSRQQ